MLSPDNFFLEADYIWVLKHIFFNIYTYIYIYIYIYIYTHTFLRFKYYFGSALDLGKGLPEFGHFGELLDYLMIIFNYETSFYSLNLWD